MWLLFMVSPAAAAAGLLAPTLPTSGSLSSAPTAPAVVPTLVPPMPTTGPAAPALPTAALHGVAGSAFGRASSLLALAPAVMPTPITPTLTSGPAVPCSTAGGCPAWCRWLCFWAGSESPRSGPSGDADTRHLRDDFWYRCPGTADGCPVWCHWLCFWAGPRFSRFGPCGDADTHHTCAGLQPECSGAVGRRLARLWHGSRFLVILGAEG